MTRKTDSKSPSTSTPTSSSLRSDAAGSATRTDRLERRGAVDASDGDGSATSTDDDAGGPIELTPAADRCRTCDATIGPRDRRLSWIVETGTATLEAHYCSEDCLPDEPPTGSRSSAEAADSERAPRDWSYCR